MQPPNDADRIGQRGTGSRIWWGNIWGTIATWFHNHIWLADQITWSASLKICIFKLKINKLKYLLTCTRLLCWLPDQIDNYMHVEKVMGMVGSFGETIPRLETQREIKHRSVDIPSAPPIESYHPCFVQLLIKLIACLHLLLFKSSNIFNPPHLSLSSYFLGWV